MPQNPTGYDTDGKPIYGFDADGRPMYKPPFDFMQESQALLNKQKQDEWKGHFVKWQQEPPKSLWEAFKRTMSQGLPKTELTSMEDYPGAKRQDLLGTVSRASRYPVGLASSIYNKVAGIGTPLNIGAAGAATAFPPAAPYIVGALGSYYAAQAPEQIYDYFKNADQRTPFQNFDIGTDLALSAVGFGAPVKSMYSAGRAPAFKNAPAMQPEIPNPFTGDLPAGIRGLLPEQASVPFQPAGLLPEKSSVPLPPIEPPTPLAQPKGGVPATLGLRPNENVPSFGGVQPPARMTPISPLEAVWNAILPRSVTGAPIEGVEGGIPRVGQQPGVMPPSELPTGGKPLTPELLPPGKRTINATVMAEEGIRPNEIVSPGKTTKTREQIRQQNAATKGVGESAPDPRETIYEQILKGDDKQHKVTPTPISKAARSSPDPDVRATAGAMEADDAQATRNGQANQKMQALKLNFTQRAMQTLREVAPEAAAIMEKTITDSALLAAQWTTRIKKTISSLNPADEIMLQKALDGEIPPEQLSPNATAAYQQLVKMTAQDGEYVTAAQQAGINLVKRNGDKVLFTGIKNYWRRKPTPEWLESRQGIVDAIMREHEATGEPITRNQAEMMVYNAMKFGEKIKGFQHKREFMSEVPYRRDMNVLYEDAIEKAERITQAKYLGPEDINDVNSPLTKAIEASKNPDLANKIVRRMLNRDPGASVSDSALLRRVSGAISIMKLGKIAISNLAPSLVNGPTAFPLMENLKGIKQLLTDPKAIQEFGDLAGIEVAFMRNLAKDVKTTEWLNKVYGFKASETGPRKLTAWIARSSADHFFELLKENPNRRNAAGLKEQLRFLTLEDPDKLLSQNSLTEQQLLRAGYRGQAYVHGMAGTPDVPFEWSKAPAWAKMALQFKKFSFNSTANFKDMVMRNPAALPKALLFGTIAGELLGDVKAGIMGSVSGPLGGENPIEAIQNRGAGLTGNDLLDREISNLSHAWLGGILLDIMTAASRQGKGAEFIAGPAYGTGFNMITGMGQTASNFWNDWDTNTFGENAKPGAKELLTNLPLPFGIGQGIYNGLYPPER